MSPGDGVSSLICELLCIFYVRLLIIFRPTGGVAFAILFFFLNLNPHHGKSLRQHISEFDFIGFGLIVGGVVLVLIGFNFSETSCKSMFTHYKNYKTCLILNQGNTPQTIAPLVIGIVILIAAAINELYTTRSAIVPPRLFKVRRHPST